MFKKPNKMFKKLILKNNWQRKKKICKHFKFTMNTIFKQKIYNY